MKFGAQGQELVTDLAFGLLAVLAFVAWWRFQRRRSLARRPPVHAKACSSKWGDVHCWVDPTDAPPRFCVSVPPKAGASAVAVTFRRPDGSASVLNLALKGGCWRSVEPIPKVHLLVAEIAVASPDGLALLSADFTGAQP